MNKIFLFLMTCMASSCINKSLNKNYLPNDAALTSVIKKVIDLDSIKTDHGGPLSKRLCPYTLDFSLDFKHDTLIPPPPANLAIINPISPGIIAELFNEKADRQKDLLDTSFYTLQIVNSKERFIDTSLLIGHKFCSIEIKKHSDYFRLDSIIVFSVPLFTKDKNYVYINYHKYGYGKGFILKNENGNWTLFKEFDTWNRN